MGYKRVRVRGRSRPRTLTRVRLVEWESPRVVRRPGPGAPRDDRYLRSTSVSSDASGGHAKRTGV
ncbi:hypothetical protein GCM10023335_01460 [Streptomyces siamensis]|uniref:Uncharacterized protein n=1 Tax=Streptomyces siamensis TaxID=1274986 RepID=A0ABP9ICG5_9ACTN